MEKEKNRKKMSKLTGIIRCLAIAMMILANIPGSSYGAAKYPSRPVEIINPFAAGAGTDLIARFLADELSKRWGQPVNVVNKVGGDTVVGTHAMMTAAPDGYTLFADSVGSSTAQRDLTGIPFDPMKRTFLCMGFTQHNALLVSGSSSWHSLKEVAEAGRKDPTAIIWGAQAGGKGSGDLRTLQFFEAAGIDASKTKRVDFAGSAKAVNALAGGHINLHATTTVTGKPIVDSGKGRCVATIFPPRSTLIPDCPSFADAGFPEVTYSSWVGLTGPLGIPDDVQKVIVSTVEEILKDPGAQDRLRKRVVDVGIRFRGPGAFREYIDEEYKFVQRILKTMTGEK